MVSNYRLSGVVASISITAPSCQWHTTKAIVGLGAEGECWICVVLMHTTCTQHRSTRPVSDLCFTELTIGSQLSCPHPKRSIEYSLLYGHHQNTVVSFLCVHKKFGSGLIFTCYRADVYYVDYFCPHMWMHASCWYACQAVLYIY